MPVHASGKRERTNPWISRQNLGGKEPKEGISFDVATECENG